MSHYTVVEVPAAVTYDLRRRVLRNGTVSQNVTYQQDDAPGTVHLAAVTGDVVVAVSTWAPERWRGDPDRPAVRLRGMAVEPSLQGTGVGAIVVSAGLERARDAGAEIVWASARDTALGFYDRLGFTIEATGFVDEGTGLPHHHIWITTSR